MECALTKDNTKVSIDAIRTVLLQKLQQIQESHDEIKIYAGCYIDTLPSKEHAQELGLKLEEVVQKLEEIIEFYGSYVCMLCIVWSLKYAKNIYFRSNA